MAMDETLCRSGSKTIESNEQVAGGPARQHRNGGMLPVFGPIILSMATLKPSGQDLGIVVGGIVIEAAHGEAHERSPQAIGFAGSRHVAASSVAP